MGNSKGKQFYDIVDSYFDSALKLCIEGLKKNPNLVIHYDLESGYPSLITREQQEAITCAWESTVKVVKDSPPLGKIICFGTGGMDEDEFKRWFVNT